MNKHISHRGRKPVVLHLVVGLILATILIFYLFSKPMTDTEKNDVPNLSVYSEEKAEIDTPIIEVVPTFKPTIAVKKPILGLVYDLFELGEKDPDSLILELNKDPLQISGGTELFQCPEDLSQRLTYPDTVDYSVLEKFRQGDESTWILFQHLRKAGGTSFCDLAASNIGRSSVPPYFCMPDDRGSLAIPPWSGATYTQTYLKKHHWRVAANEWDALFSDMLHWPGAVLGTTIRHPIDRWYSQYRFEHLEHRDGSEEGSKRQSFRKYYNSMRGWTITSNYYVKTFIGGANAPDEPKNKGDFYWTYHKYEKIPITKQMFADAINNILHLHFIIVLEYMNTSSIILKRTLNWSIPPKQVLPHESQAIRKDKKSITAIEALSNEDYHYMQVENLYDLLFFEVVKRIYLERLLCVNKLN